MTTNRTAQDKGLLRPGRLQLAERKETQVNTRMRAVIQTVLFVHALHRAESTPRTTLRLVKEQQIEQGVLRDQQAVSKCSLTSLQLCSTLPRNTSALQCTCRAKLRGRGAEHATLCKYIPYARGMIRAVGATIHCRPEQPLISDELSLGYHWRDSCRRDSRVGSPPWALSLTRTVNEL